jgi:hypothetical protein
MTGLCRAPQLLFALSLLAAQVARLDLMRTAQAVTLILPSRFLLMQVWCQVRVSASQSDQVETQVHLVLERWEAKIHWEATQAEPARHRVHQALQVVVAVAVRRAW